MISDVFASQTATGPLRVKHTDQLEEVSCRRCSLESSVQVTHKYDSLPFVALPITLRRNLGGIVRGRPYAPYAFDRRSLRSAIPSTVQNTCWGKMVFLVGLPDQGPLLQDVPVCDPYGCYDCACLTVIDEINGKCLLMRMLSPAIVG
jgi:hypothetical protein